MCKAIQLTGMSMFIVTILKIAVANPSLDVAVAKTQTLL
jgi:hypothetical protein